MSNAYINQVLFGVSKVDVDARYIQDLRQYMLTVHSPSYENHSIPPLIHRPGIVQRMDILSLSPVPTLVPSPSLPSPSLTQPIIQKPRYQQQTNSLFWSIYDIENPEDAFMGTKANAEIEHRLKVVASLKKTPKRLKETNSKLTIEQTQALMGAMLVAKEDRIDFCIAYAVYYCKPIAVVYSKSYTVFSPTVDVELEGEDVILLYASKSGKNVVYSSEKNVSSDMIANIIATKVRAPLKSISNYKAHELDDIAERLNIATTLQTDAKKDKRRKKEDIYNDILVAIHDDVNFTSTILS